MGGVDVGGIFKKVTGINPGSAEELKNGAAGAAGKIVGGKINEAAKPGVDAVTGKINEGKEAALSFIEKAKLKTATGFAVGRLPDALPLDGPNAGKFTTFIENALNEGGYSKVKADGKPDKATLDAVNDLRQKAGQAPLGSVSEFTKADLKLVIENLEKTDSQRAQNVLKSVPDVLNGVRESGAFPEPKKATPAPGGPGMDNTGG